MLRFIFSGVVALAVIVLGFWLYQNRFAKAPAMQSSAAISEQEKYSSQLPEPTPVTDEDQVKINAALSQMAQQSAAGGSAKSQANFEQQSNALPN